MADNILDHLCSENEKYRNLLKEVRKIVGTVPLFADTQDVEVARDKALRDISELLEENGFT